MELAEAWRRYKGAGDVRARERLVVAYSPLVKYVAGRLPAAARADIDQAELIACGLRALIDAIERFDTVGEASFEAYAIPHVREAIAGELCARERSAGSARARAREIELANARLEQRLGRAPSDEELAAELGVSAAELGDSLAEIARTSTAAVEEPWSLPGGPGDAPAPGGDDDAAALRDRLADAIVRLPHPEQLVLALYYDENLTLREIGEVLGVSETRASQLHVKALLRVRSRVAEAAHG